MILSGTPSTNGLKYLWPQYYILDGGKRLGGSYEKFIKEYFKYVDRAGNDYTPKDFKDKQRSRIVIKSEEHEAKIHKLVGDITYRIDGSEHLNLPPLIYNNIDVVLPPHVTKMMKDFRRKKVHEFESGKIATAAFAAASSMKLRQMIQGCIYTDEEEGKEKPKGPRHYERLHDTKLQVLKALVEEAAGQGILCAIQFKFELDMILEAFPGTPAIVGGVKDADVMTYIRAWNRGKIPLMLCHPASLSHSVNLQTGSHILVYYGIPWSLERYLQLNKRLHRTGQLNTVIIHHIVAKGTEDEAVLGALRENKSIEDALLDFLLKNTEERDKHYESV